MPDRNQAALDFLLTRRSRPAKTLDGPVPDHTALTEILTAAARTPDHGKLEPWRFIVLDTPALRRLGDLVGDLSAQRDLNTEDTAKARHAYDTGHLAVVVVESPKASPKIPPIEQTYSAGAVCLSLLNAALAAGWGANWLSGWPVYDSAFMGSGLDLSTHERIAGIIHIGTERSAPPERPRPDLGAIVSWPEGME
jgi:nitroreductase